MTTRVRPALPRDLLHRTLVGRGLRRTQPPDPRYVEVAFTLRPRGMVERLVARARATYGG